MNDRRRIQLAKAIAARLDLLARALDEVDNGTTLMGRMRELQGNIRARSYDSTPTSYGSDVVGEGLPTVDQATIDEANLDKALKRLATDATLATIIINRYPVPHRATAVDRNGLGLIHADPGCENCAKTEAAAGGPRWEPPRTANATTVDERLEEPALLCDWCYQRVRQWGRLPTPAELERHHRGERVPWPDDVPRPDLRRS